MAGPTLVELFSKYSELLKSLKDQTTGHEDPGTSKDLPAVWNHVDSCMKYISQQSTKLSLACSEPPFPTGEEVLPILRNIESASINLVSACLGVSSLNHGATLKAILVENVKTVLDNIVELLGNLSESCAKKRHKFLQSTGHVWEVTDKFSHLPKNNKDAVIVRLKEISQLLQDAHEEFDEAIKENVGNGDGKGYDVIDELDDDDFTVRWNAHELDMVTTSLGLIKTSRVCLSKVIKAIELNGSTDESATEEESTVTSDTEELMSRLTLSGDLQNKCSPNHVRQLDVTLSAASRISPAVDDLLSSLYPPIMELETAKNSVHNVNQVLKDFLQVARHFHFVNPSIDFTWLDFLSKAISHNFDKTLNALSKFGKQ